MSINGLTSILLAANLSNAKKNTWNHVKWVFIWEYSVRAFQWIPTWQGLDAFPNSLHTCTLDKRSLSIERVDYSPQADLSLRVAVKISLKYCIILTLMLLVATLAITKGCKTPEKMTENPGTWVLIWVLSKSFPMNTNMTGFIWFSNFFASCALDESSLSIGRVFFSWLCCR